MAVDNNIEESDIHKRHAINLGSEKYKDTDKGASETASGSDIETKKFDAVEVYSDSLAEHGGDLPKKHIFQDAEIAAFYQDLYEKSEYEGRHLFDPEFDWEEKEENHIRRKTDFYVGFWAFFMFFALDIDRYNLANAVSDTLFEDLNITTTDYNLGNTINFVCFMAAELPSQLISKKLGPDIWIPTQMTLWSVVAISQCAIQNRAGFLATRAIVGALEGGFIPDVVLWMSYFFTSRELTTRLGYFYSANFVTQAVSALIAYGIFHIKSGWSGWRWLFLIEGIFTLIVGLASYFWMPPSAVQTKKWYRPKGWYTEREEKIIVNRILRDDPTKGDMNNRAALDWRGVLKSVLDYDLWPIYIDRMFIDMAAQPISVYLPIILKNLGFKTLTINLLMIPPQGLALVVQLIQVHLSQYFEEYGLHLFMSAFWLVPCIAAMRWWPGFLHNQWGSYVLLMIVLGYPETPPLTNAWSSHNSGSVRTRTVSGALVNMFSQAACIVGNNIYRADDAPRYNRGNEQIFALSITACVCVLATKFYYIWRNRQRDRQWKKMSELEQATYLRENRNQGNRRLDFRFAS